MKNEYSLMELWEKNAVLVILTLILAQTYKAAGETFLVFLTVFPLSFFMFEWLNSTFKKELPKDGHRFYSSDLINKLKKKKEPQKPAHGAGCEYEKALNKNNENIKEEVK